VIEPATLLKGARLEEPQRIARAFQCLTSFNPVAIRGDAESSQTKTGSGDAGYVAVTIRQGLVVHPRTIGHESCVWIGLFPEVPEGALLEIIYESVCGVRGNAPDEQQNNDAEPERTNVLLPFDHFKLRLDHVL
jgi:hypothetical protein